MLNIITVVGLLTSFNIAIVTSRASPIILFELNLNTHDELHKNEGNNIVLKRSLDNLGNGNIMKRALRPGPLDPLDNGNIPKWSKKNSHTRDYKRSLDSLGNGNILKRAFGPGSLDPLGNGNIPKWSKKNDKTRDYKRSLDNVQFFRIVG